MGLVNHHTDNSIRTKTAHWHSRPIANCIVDLLDNQDLVGKDVINELKQNKNYHSKDRISFTKSAQ